MAISVDTYIAAVRGHLPEARALLDRHTALHQDVDLVARVNNDFTHLLAWSWVAGDVETCRRVLEVMEMALLDTSEDDYAPVYNSVGIGVIETLDRDIRPDEFEKFVDTWPPGMREIGRRFVAARADYDPDWDG